MTEQAIRTQTLVRGLHVVRLQKISVRGAGVMFEALASPGSFSSGLCFCAFEALERVEARVQGREISEYPDRVRTRKEIEAIISNAHPATEVAILALEKGPRSAEWLALTYINIETKE